MNKSIILVLILICITSGCENTNVDKGCGCNTTTVTGIATSKYFSGYQYNGGLVYYTNNFNEGAWYVGVNIPSTNSYGICKICNPDISIVRAFTDTSSRKSVIPVSFAGKLKKLCQSEPQNFGFLAVPETFFSHITIDSIKKK